MEGALRESAKELRTHGVRKYPPTSALLASSAGLGWSTISVELRSHEVSEAPAIVPQHVEICLVVAGNKDGLVRRTGAGFCQEEMPKTGARQLFRRRKACSAEESCVSPWDTHRG